jgi:hypothetical protein
VHFCSVDQNLIFRLLPFTDGCKGFKFGVNIAEAPTVAPDLFVGRASDLQKMEEILLPESEAHDQRVLILGGLGGIGKTQLAIAYARRHAIVYDSVFWLNAKTKSTLQTSFRLIALRLAIHGIQQLDEDQIIVHILNWLSQEGNCRWLLIFDNHDDLQQYHIKQYYPYASQGSIIVTTRSPDRLSGKVIRIGKLDNIHDGLRILSTRSQREKVEQGQEILSYTAPN